MASKQLFKMVKTDTSVLNVYLDFFGKVKERWFLLSSDRHHDNPQCDRKMEKDHLDEALDKKAGIIDTGDLFCAMQGVKDKRSSKKSIRKEHLRCDYFDALVEDAADFYMPYAHNFINLGHGNHETAILKNNETDLTQRLAASMNYKAGSNIQTLGYSGFIRFKCNLSKTSRRLKTLFYTHGYGGGGPVSQDMIQANRQQAYIEGVDIMVSGHVHRSWVQEFIKQRVSVAGEIERVKGFYVKTPTYKDEYKDLKGGFAVEKGLGPRPLGAYWLRMYVKHGEIKMQVIKAD